MNAVPQCGSWCGDGNSSSAIYRNADAVEYEQHYTSLQCSCVIDISIIFYRSSTQRTAPQIHFLALPQCLVGAETEIRALQLTHRNADAVEYERSFIRSLINYLNLYYCSFHF